jgi:hypothetical protein
VTGHLSSRLGSAAFFLIAMAILAGGCNHPRSTNEGNAAASPVVSRLSHTLVGKRITIRGELLPFKCGLGISIDSGEAVCLTYIDPSDTSNELYPKTHEKFAEATGTLRFYHDTTPTNERPAIPRDTDYYYFDRDATQVRLINYSRTASPPGSPLSQALVGKRITIRGKLQNFGLPDCLGIQLDDVEVVCLEAMHSKSVSADEDPYRRMYDKLVEATGTLRFYHDTTPADEHLGSQRELDHFYFEEETTQVRLVTKPSPG